MNAMSTATVTFVTPMPFTILNFGPEIQSVTFRYAGQDHTINRRGRANVKAYIRADGTSTVTNSRTERMVGMVGPVRLLTAYSLAGVAYELNQTL